MKSYKRYLLLIVYSLYACSIQATPAHEHSGILKPYLDEPPAIHLNPDEKQQLHLGKAIFKQLQFEDSKRGIAIFRVKAKAETIWSVIKAFSSYPDWIADVETTHIYQQKDNLIHVRFTAPGLFSKTVWHVIHNYPDEKNQRNWGTWQLDYDYKSDLDDSVGFWRVLPTENQSEFCDVIYSADIKLKGLMTTFFEGSIIENSLKEASQWVKKQAEYRQLNDGK